MPRNAVALEIFYAGAWHDLVVDKRVLAGRTITVRRGDGAESASVRPANLEASLLNFDDVFRTTNPESPLYGLAGRNTPVRVSVAGAVRAHVQASTWEASETRDFRREPRRGSAWVDIVAGGLLEQLGTWKEPLRSPLERNTLSIPDLTGFWPLEDEREAVQLGTPLASGLPGTYSGDVTLAVDDVRPAGASRTVQVGATGVIGGRFRPGTTDGYQISWAAYVPATLTAAYEEIFRWVDTIGRVWAWEINEDSYAFRIYDTLGTTLSYTSSTYGTLDPASWVRFRMKVTAAAGTLTYEPAWYVEGATFATGSTKTFAAAKAGQPRSWTTPGTTYSTDAAYCCVFATSDTSADLVADGDLLAGFNGHIGETAASRFLRLLTELGIDASVVGTVGQSQPMGAQPAAPILELLREIRDTEDGLLFDAVDDLSVVLMTRRARINQTPVTIDVTELPARPREVVDQQQISNIVTVEQRDGGAATARDDTSPIGTQNNPDGIGPYETTVAVSVDDQDDLPGLAGYWLARRTVDLPRYPAVTVNLAALSASRVAEIEALDVGSVIEITGYRPEPIRLQILGYTETIGWPNERRITFATVSDEVFDAGTYDGGRRYQVRTVTMAAAAGPTATTLTLSITGEETLSLTAAYDLMIGGERVGVPAAGMGARTGSPGAYQQVITGAVRSKNGVRKTLDAGTAVTVASRGRYVR